MNNLSFCPFCGFKFIKSSKDKECPFCNYTTSEESDIKRYFISPEEITNIFDKVLKK